MGHLFLLRHHHPMPACFSGFCSRWKRGRRRREARSITHPTIFPPPPPPDESRGVSSRAGPMVRRREREREVLCATALRIRHTHSLSRRGHSFSLSLTHTHSLFLRVLPTSTIRVRLTSHLPIGHSSNQPEAPPLLSSLSREALRLPN